MWIGKERPFIFWLLTAQLAAVLPLLTFSALLMHQVVQETEKEALADLEQRVRVAATAVARETDRLKTRLQLLSEQDIAQAGDVKQMRRLAARMVETGQVIASISAMDRQGQLIFTTQQPEGMPLPSMPTTTGVTPIFEHGEISISGLTPGDDNHTLLIRLATPWRVEGEIRYSLRLFLKPEGLGGILRDQQWPDSWTAALIDQNMRIMARSRDEAKNFGQTATPTLQEFIGTRGSGTGRSRTRDGVDVITAVVKVPGTPWWLVAGLPYAELKAETSAPVQQLVAGGIVVVVLGIFLAALLSRRLNRDMLRLAQGQSTSESRIQELRALDVQRLILDNELVAMVRLKERRSIWHNRAMEKMFGYTAEELAGHSPRLMHPDQASFEDFGQQAYPVLRSGQPYRTQLQMVRKDASRLWADVSGIALSPDETLWMIVDITTMKTDQAHAEAMAFHDALTGLPNRALLQDRLRLAVPAAERAKQVLVLAFIDLDGFKAVNDSLGHAAGDTLLRAVAARILTCVRAHDTVARLGGDEFVILLTQLNHAREATDVLDRIRRTIAEPVELNSKTGSVTASVGIAVFPDEAQNPDALLALADARMYREKQSRSG